MLIYMGNIFHKSEKKEREFMNKIKEYDVENTEANTEVTINNIVLVKALKELITEVEELQEKDNQRVHLVSPKLDCMNFSLIY